MTDRVSRPFAYSERLRIGGADALLAFARFLVASEFMLYGTRKYLNPMYIYTLIGEHGLPGELVYIVQPWQVIFGTLLFIGFQTRLAALALFGFCIIAPSIFWLNSLENLTRDYATAGGLLLFFACGPGALSVDSSYGRGRDLVVRIFASIMENATLMGWILLFGRVLLALPFVADAAKKLVQTEQEQAFFATHGLPGAAVYLVVAIEIVFGGMLLAGYRLKMAAVALIVWSAIQGFILHSPAKELSVPSADLLSVFIALFTSSGGVLSSFFKDLAVIGGLIAAIIYNPALTFHGDRELGGKTFEESC
jgi:putative oxidoreductase